MDHSDFVNKLIPVGIIESVVRTDANEFVQMADRARQFLRQRPWCKDVGNGFFDRGLAGVIALFLFEVRCNAPSDVETGWVIVGDIPPVFIEASSCPTGLEVLDVYVGGLEIWLAAARSGEKMDGFMPVYDPNGSNLLDPTEDNVRYVESRVSSLVNEVVPWLQEWSSDE